MPSYFDDLTRLQQQAYALSTRLSNDSDREDDSPSSSDVLLGLMKNVCEVVQRATGDGSASADMLSIVVKASDLLEEMVNMAYDEHDLYDFVPSYAHIEGRTPLVADPAEGKNSFGMLISM